MEAGADPIVTCSRELLNRVLSNIELPWRYFDDSEKMRNTNEHLIKFDVQCGKKTLMPNAKGPDELVHPCILIWASSVCRHILQYPFIL